MSCGHIAKKSSKMPGFASKQLFKHGKMGIYTWKVLWCPIICCFSGHYRGFHVYMPAGRRFSGRNHGNLGTGRIFRAICPLHIVAASELSFWYSDILEATGLFIDRLYYNCWLNVSIKILSKSQDYNTQKRFIISLISFKSGLSILL